MLKNITLNVYLQGNCFKFCINGKHVEFENIIKTLKDVSILDDTEDCPLENPLYTFEIKIKDDGNDASGFMFELKIEPIEANLKIEPIIVITSKTNNEYNFIVQSQGNKKKADCSDILNILINLTEGLISSSRQETLNALFPKQPQTKDYY